MLADTYTPLKRAMPPLPKHSCNPLCTTLHPTTMKNLYFCRKYAILGHLKENKKAPYYALFKGRVYAVRRQPWTGEHLDAMFHYEWPRTTDFFWQIQLNQSYDGRARTCAAQNLPRCYANTWRPKNQQNHKVLTGALSWLVTQEAAPTATIYHFRSEPIR